MAKKPKKSVDKTAETLDSKTHIPGAGEVVNQQIVNTLELNFMPYAMSVIMSRAIPEIDGFKIRKYRRQDNAAQSSRRRRNL